MQRSRAAAKLLLLEPNMLCSRKYGPENDFIRRTPSSIRGRQPMYVWEELVKQFYDAVRNSPDWNSTLLVITLTNTVAVTTMYRLSCLRIT